ncbi:MAG: tryptophan-rich sensory protein, partial [Lachnospiraceae bacterium]|nr:tryptophan-rich sensory protein [Lachnospiraceae bacterium]
MKIKNKSALIIAILIPIAVGTWSAILSGNMLLYSTINKPPISPPGFIFPIVWIILY